MAEKPQFESITPAQIDLTQPAAPAGNRGGKPVKSGKFPLVIVLGVILVAIAAAVLVVLPKIVATTGPAAATAQPQTPVIATGEAPYQQAQQAKARRQAQDILAKVLPLQDELAAKNVSLWADSAFQEAKQLMQAGDGFYRQGEFQQALAQYQQALAVLEKLQQQSLSLVGDKLAEGNSALMAGNQQQAASAFELVQALEPGNSQASQGLARAQLLPQTLPLLQQAKTAMANKDWSQAKSLLQQLLALDSAHSEAAALLNSSNRELTAQAFTAAMSAGFRAMQGGNPQAAASHFEKALGLDPNSADARASLQQARDQQQTIAINNILKEAAALEGREQWAAAAASYQQVLDRDDSVVAARVGLLRSQARAELDRSIAAILTDPLRLASGPVLISARQLLADGRNIASPGPGLQQQLDSLQSAIEAAQIAVTVELTSDNHTRVTVLRVGEMGTFTSHKLSLRPGRYVALGSRPGYRDVRVNFEVSAHNSASVAVICKEPV